LWSKPKDESGNTFEPAAPPTPVSIDRGVSVHSPTQTAAIGSSMRIKGEIRSREELLVDGEVEGVMESESLLTVGRNGNVKANMKAREVVIFGTVRGDVEVTGKIAIRGEGSLIGDIKCAGISIDDGAYFKGSIDIARPQSKAALQAS
jgi:cytoskeletal protein CcmA (bactofilin family)